MLTRVFQGILVTFREVSRVFQECFKGIFKKVLRVFQGNLQWISNIFERSSKVILEKFQRCFKGV